MRDLKSFGAYSRGSSFKKIVSQESSSIDLLMRLFKLISTVSLMLGGAVVLLYLGSYGVFPRGLGVGDYLFLMQVALVFGMVLVVGAVYGAFGTYWIVVGSLFLKTKFSKESTGGRVEIHSFIKGKPLFLVSVLMTVLLSGSIWMVRDQDGSHEYAILIGYFSVVGIWLLAIFVRGPAS